MKYLKSIYSLCIATAFILQSCYKDDSVAATNVLPEIEVSGIQNNYTVITKVDSLNIKPVLENITHEADYSFMWLLYDKTFTVNAGTVAKPDTLASTKDLSILVNKKAADYILVFNIIHTKTGVTQMNRYNLVVNTLNMNGWYILKDHNNQTDYDFFHPDGKIENWMQYHGYTSLTGKAVKSIFIPDMRTSLNSVDRFGALAVLSDQDIAMFRLENGQRLYTYDNLFFTKPSVKKPQNITTTPAGTVGLINDSKFYVLNKGGLFANTPPNDYVLSDKIGVTSYELVFDTKSKSLLYVSGGSLTRFIANGSAMMNTASDLMWIEGAPELRNTGAMIFKNPTTGTGRLIRIDASVGNFFIPGSKLVTLEAEIPAENPVLQAEQLGGNYDSDLLYYSKGNQVFIFDFASLSSSLQVSFPEGEKVTRIQHIKYPVPVRGVVNKLNYIAIATFKDGKYKVYLYSLNSIGGLIPKSAPDFEGTGRVSTINYIENGLGSRVF